MDTLEEHLRLQSELLRQQRELLRPETTWSFTQGLIVGQVSVIVIIIIFIKFFVFAEPSPASPKDASGVIVRRKKKKEDEDPPDSLVRTILEKTYYDVENHSSESLDWLNVLLAQTIAQLRTEALLADNIYHSLNEFLESTDLPDYLDAVKITEIDIGDDFPILSNCRITHSKGNSARLDGKIDVDLSDTLTLGIETRLVLNHPRPQTAVLPVQLSVSIVRFSGCLTVSLVSEGDDRGTALMFSFSPDYRLEFTVKSLIGSRAKLQNVPKISSLIEGKLRSWFSERCVEPRYQVVRLPSFWPRRNNTVDNSL